MPKPRTPWTIGWEAAKANATPGFILQGAMLAVLVGYYGSGRFAGLLDQLARYKQQHGLLFVVSAGIMAGALFPELFVVFFLASPCPAARTVHWLRGAPQRDTVR